MIMPHKMNSFSISCINGIFCYILPHKYSICFIPPPKPCTSTSDKYGPNSSFWMEKCGTLVIEWNPGPLWGESTDILRLGDHILYMRRLTGWSLVQVRPCRLCGTKLLPEMMMTVRNKLNWNFSQNTKRFIQENASENIVCETAAICPGADELSSRRTRSDP